MVILMIAALLAIGTSIGAHIGGQLQRQQARANLSRLTVDGLASTSAPAAQTPSAAASRTVELRVDGRGTARVNYVAFTGSDSVTTKPTLVRLPWHHRVSVPNDHVADASFTVTGHNETSAKRITVSIVVDGTVQSTAHRTGRYALVTTTTTLK